MWASLATSIGLSSPDVRQAVENLRSGAANSVMTPEAFKQLEAGAFPEEGGIGGIEAPIEESVNAWNSAVFLEIIRMLSENPAMLRDRTSQLLRGMGQVHRQIGQQAPGAGAVQGLQGLGQGLGGP